MSQAPHCRHGQQERGVFCDQCNARHRAEKLLKLHGGHCFVMEGNELVEPFREMESEGLVTVAAGVGEIKGIDVKRKGYRPKRASRDEIEQPAH